MRIVEGRTWQGLTHLRLSSGAYIEAKAEVIMDTCLCTSVLAGTKRQSTLFANDGSQKPGHCPRHSRIRY